MRTTPIRKAAVAVLLAAGAALSVASSAQAHGPATPSPVVGTTLHAEVASVLMNDITWGS